MNKQMELLTFHFYLFIFLISSTYVYLVNVCVFYKFRHSGTCKVKQRLLLSIKIAYVFVRFGIFMLIKHKLCKRMLKNQRKKRQKKVRDADNVVPITYHPQSLDAEKDFVEQLLPHNCSSSFSYVDSACKVNSSKSVLFMQGNAVSLPKECGSGIQQQIPLQVFQPCKQINPRGEKEEYGQGDARKQSWSWNEGVTRSSGCQMTLGKFIQEQQF